MLPGSILLLATVVHEAVFPLSRFFSANRRFIEAMANKFWQYSKHSIRKLDKFVEI